MTKIEKILNLLDINEYVPALVVDENINILTTNEAWKEQFKPIEREKNFLKLFDRNTSLLVKNSFLDATTFLKIQRREILFTVNNKIQTYRLLISPFKIEGQLFFYAIVFNEDHVDKLLSYPSLDDSTIGSKYEDIINQVKSTFPKTLADKKNLQFNIDIEREPIVIKDRTNILYVNQSFKNISGKIENDVTNFLIDDILPEKLLLKYKSAETELLNTKCLFVIESTNYNPNDIQQKNRIILYPVLSKNDEVDKIIIFGSIEFITNKEKIYKTEESKKSFTDKEKVKDKISISDLPEARIIYDKNTFEILDANSAASSIYGYTVSELKKMDITKLYPPEEMQKLLTPIADKSKLILKQTKKNSGIIEVEVERANLIWNAQEACMDIIKIVSADTAKIITEKHLPDEKEISTDKEIKGDVTEDKTEDKQRKEIKETTVKETHKPVDKAVGEKTSPFLSLLFHELLTPVNVILGFVQEIIDSIDKPTEEQEESAQIIKDNQQLLLQTMNTAVQYAQLEENGSKLNIEEFEFNNYLIDLQDSLSRISEKENVKIIYDKIPDTLLLKTDRKKMLALVSLFIRLAIKLADSREVFISFELKENKFFTLVRFNDVEKLKKVTSGILEIFDPNLFDPEKDYGISPITLRLAKKLNEILNGKITEYLFDNTSKSIALLLPANVEQPSAIRDEVKIEDGVDLVEGDFVETEVIIEAPLEETLEEGVDKTGVTLNSKIDEKIIEDIEEEKDIRTEEIATLEKKADDTVIGLSKLSCLFIDDSVDSQLLFKSQMNDFRVLKVSSNLTEALPLLKKYNFNVIFVDINLNDKYNGFDALKIIRQFNNYKTTPIIAVTAYPFEGDRDKFINFGFTDYLAKPLLREQLVASLEQIFA